ncbi:MAG: SH3 domain-containing protein [Clostridia bacterium]|nr:SH3 domain-containing protein [Clostridia bacterium]
MKKGIASLLALVLALGLVLSAAPALAAGEYAVVINTGYLNVRSQPSASSQWLGSAARSSWVEVLSAAAGGWYYCRVVDSGVRGYMSGTYLAMAGSSGGAGVGGDGTVSNNGSYVNMRSYPSYGGAVLGQVPSGTVVHILAEENGWFYVQMNGVYGYMRSEFITAASVTPGGTTARVKAGSLRLRSAPTTSSSVLGTYGTGTLVTVLLKGKVFWQVRVNGKTGFMDSSYLTEDVSPAPVPPVPVPPAPAPVSETYAVVGGGTGLNLRVTPSASASVAAVLSPGTRLDLLFQGETWCKVRVSGGGKTGYVMTKYITLYNAPATAAKTVTNPGSYVNLRKGAGQSYGVMQKVWDGSIVTVLIPGNVWCQVRWGTQTGYMMTRFLK